MLFQLKDVPTSISSLPPDINLGILRLYCVALRLSKAPYRTDPGLDSGANFLQQTDFNNACQNFALL